MDDFQKTWDMIMAVRKGDMQKLRDIIEEFGLSFTPLLDDGNRLLTDAVEKNQAEMVAYLLRKNAKVNSNREVHSLLQMAAMNNNTEIFKMLLKHGAKINDHNCCHHKSPIELAVEHDNIEIARLIVKHKNFGKKYGRSLLHTAVQKNNLEMVSLLLEAGVDVNEYDDGISTPSHHAVLARNNGILQLLLDYGADINIKNNYGNTPICLVLMQLESEYYLSPHIFGVPMFCDTQQKSKLDILLDNDADINCVDIRKYFQPIPHRIRMPLHGDGRVEYPTSAKTKCIIKQIVKLRSESVPLSHNNNILLSSLIECKTLNDYKEKCEQEISRAMIEKIPNSGISFHNILSKNMNFLAACSKNINLQTFIFSSEISERYPIYGSTMKCRFSKGLERKNLLDKSIKVFHNLFPVAHELLSDGVDDVFKCLDNKDLRHFLRMF